VAALLRYGSFIALVLKQAVLTTIPRGVLRNMYRTLDTMDIIGISIVLASLIRLTFF
jgi:hypothetical protein